MVRLRRRTGSVVGALVLLTVVVCLRAWSVDAGAEGATPGSGDGVTYADLRLLSDGVALDPDGLPRIVPAGAVVEHDPAQLARQDEWLADGIVPGPARYAELAELALRDLEALLLPGGVAIAGASQDWRYVWPRDASFTAAALARTGHPADAHEILLHLQLLQDLGSTDGVFEARYLPDTTGEVPDDRGLQLDGNGWVLWAAAEWYAAAEPASRDARLAELRPLVTRSVAAIRANVDPVTGLPAVGSDYWEIPESTPTLGTLAALLLGLRAAEPLLDALAELSAADLIETLERGLEHFAPGFPRHPGGQERDTAVTFLMPPFAPHDDVVRLAWEQAAASMARPAGGLAPGAGWRQDGVSWTPTTSLFALTAAASGDVESATRWLDWLDDHRTPGGSLPEKVLWDGSPAAVAPLAWTCAVVLLTLDELDRASSRPVQPASTIVTSGG